MFGADDHDQMRQTQNGFGKGKWKPDQQIGGLQPDEDSDEDEGVDDDDEEDDDEDNIEQDDDDEESDHNF